jgi:sugar/nucleoside kinase (ribokinase family)
MFEGKRIFSAPAFPLEEVADPTGAGDSFAGGFVGFLASRGAPDSGTLREAVVHGSVVASFTCEAFGVGRLASLTSADIARRYEAFRTLAAF